MKSWINVQKSGSLETSSVETVTRDSSSLFRRIRQCIAFEMLQKNVRQRVNARENCKICMGRKWNV
jgi:hypothetical protein